MIRAIVVPFLSWLLHKANAHAAAHREFYELKDRLLRQYAVRDGEDVQRIRKRCWGADWDRGCDGETCTRCGGTGIFEERWILLERWRLGTRIFHRPAGPAKPVAITYIDGIIEHKHTSYRASSEARLWLYLIFDRRQLLKSLRTSRATGRHWRPMLALQAIVFEAAMIAHRYRVRECWNCNRRFLRPSRDGYTRLECRRCERDRLARLADLDLDLPF